MKKRILSLMLCLFLLFSLAPALPGALAAEGTLPTALRLDPSETNGLPSGISLIKTTDYTLYLPGNAQVDQCFFSWDGGLPASDGSGSYESGALPIPAPGETKTYTFTNGSSSASFTVKTYQGSEAVRPIFIEIDESLGTIAAMNNDPNHNTECQGVIYIDGELHQLPKMKGRGNYAWSQSKDKRAYNITLGAKTKLLGIDCEKTKKWSLLANVCDHSLLRDKVGYDLGYELGIGFDSASADIWMNGVYQGTYLVTPKTDSFTSKDGYLLENDNNREPAISAGGDPSFTLTGLYGSNGSDTNSGNGDNRITVKDIGDNVLLNAEGVVDESEANLNAVTERIKAHLQDAWDAIRSETGYNAKGVYYADYIDLETFAKMYLVLEYCKDYDVCAGSNFFQRYATGDADKYYAGPVWDLDSSLGCTQENGGLRLGSDISMTTGYGFFIQNIYDYRTSIYKKLGMHEDFMQMVYAVYEQNKEAFDAIPEKVTQFSDEIADSAMMNFQKVDPVDNYNIARYTRQTVKNQGTPYEQVYLATTDSKTDWPIYVANLKTFCGARTKFFDEFMHEPYSNPVIGESGEDLAPSGHVYSDYTASWENLNGINNPEFEPTSSNMGIGKGWGNWSQTTGSQHYVGFTWDNAVTTNAIDLYWYDDNGGTRVPSDFHLEYKDETGTFQRITFDTPVSGAKALNQYNRLTFPTVTTKDLRLVMTTASNASGIYRFKVYSAVELEGIPVVFHSTSRASVTTFDTQDLTAGGHENADYAFARSSDTGEILQDGNGQVNFVVVPAEGYVIDEIVAEPAENYGNLKGPADTGSENAYRITKITGRVDVTVKVKPADGDDPGDDPGDEPCEHEFGDDGICVKCGEEAFKAEFVCGEGASVTVFKVQDLTSEGTVSDYAFPRNSVTGDIDVSGDGQVNFVVNTTGDYQIVSVTAVPTTNYKNLKGPADTGVENAYRITKLTGPVTVTIETAEFVCEHEFDDEGVCIHCGKTAFRASFVTDGHCSITAYDTQDLAGAGRENAEFAFARDSLEGTIDLSGAGQVNFVVVPEAGYEVASVEAAPQNYKNLKGPDETGFENCYRITKVTGDFTVTVTMQETAPIEDPVDKSALEAAIAEAEAVELDAYTDESVGRLAKALAAAETVYADEDATQEEVDAAAEALLAAIAALETPEDQPPFRFDDVQNEEDYYFRPVYWAYEHTPQITAGTSDTLFSPHADCTRAQVVTFLWRAAGTPTAEGAENPFADVKEDAYYYDAVLWAVAQEITAGTAKTVFSPNASCTRGQIVTFLYRFAGKPAVSDTENPFADVAEGAYYYEPVLWAVAQEITAGTSSTKFSPNATCTRAQVVTFLYRLLADE